MAIHISRRQRHPLVFRQIEVKQVTRLTPHMQRIVFGGDQLHGFLSLSPEDHVKLLIPPPGQPVQWPSLGAEGLVYPDGAAPLPMRDYTPRHYDGEANELTIDFVLHGDGPASTWAAQAQPGQWLGLGGPRGSFIVADDFDTYVMFGDETALPAIGRWLEEMPEGTRAIVRVEIPGQADQQALSSRAELDLQWLHRDGADASQPGLLEQALRELPPADGDTFYWIAAESRRARAMRLFLSEQRQVPKDWLKATGYWSAHPEDDDADG